jgi:hypothetical protein
MNKRSKPSPDDTGSREQQLDQLLTAMDANDPFSRYGLEPDLKQIEARWLAAQKAGSQSGCANIARR